ncbi:MAG TPA: hypothetical protein VM166_02900 [Gemmatimonadaceae bacterium]|nr:hypothetical protein [Gemmatimonadaceae bacterium]
MTDEPRKSSRKSSGKPRTLSRVVATTPGCAPLREAYEQARAQKPKTWVEVQDIYLRAMEAFDANIATGVADMGDLQNGKGDFFNDLLALLLENCAGIQLFSRGDVPGLIFPKHHLDVTFPSTGAVEFVLEAKAVGTPKHPGSPRQRAVGRAGSADLDKRVKEIGFKTIDLKAEYARILTARGESAAAMAGDLSTWLRSVKPRSYVFFAARVISDNDRARVVRFADLAALVSDAVGVFCFRPISANSPTRYAVEPVPSHVELDRVLYRACRDLASIHSSTGVESPSASPAELAESIPIEPENHTGRVMRKKR